MPYAPGSEQKSITVTGVTITLNPLPSWVKQGDKVTFTGTVMSNGTPVGGPVEIYRAGLKIAEGYAMAAAGGVYAIDWTVPYGLGCRAHSFAAKHVNSGAWSQGRSMYIAYPTVITIDAPSKVNIGESFEIRGTLKYARNSPTDLQPLTGKTVKVYIDDRLIASTITDSSGNWAIRTHIDSSGTHTIKAVYEGENLPSTLAITAVSVEDIKAISAPLAIIGLAIGLAYLESKGLLRW
ncbi:hypothetical protein DRO24_03525 [Candidatus Bathyarchaeota archaeon]|nr:MAG: hypothetical protein DRO24_03525 [Candidatus Bathyarchaeota archaeon]